MKCNAQEEINGRETTCGRPAYTTVSGLCEKHFMAKYENTYVRMQKYPKAFDINSFVDKDNNSHSIVQILFAYEMMCKMNTLLKDKGIKHWFEYCYQKNPNYAQVVEMLNQTDWKPQQSNNPLAQSIGKIGF